MTTNSTAHPLTRVAAVLLPLVFCSFLIGQQAPADAWSVGRTAFERRGCVECHQAGDAAIGVIASHRGPDLRQVAPHLHLDWIVEVLLDPKAGRPRALMPRLLAGEGAHRDAIDLAAFLVPRPAQSKPFDPGKDAVTRGKKLFLVKGCAACHTVAHGDSEVFKASQEDSRLPLDHLPHRSGPAFVETFLIDPLRYHPEGFMPNPGLNRNQAKALAAFLYAGPQPEREGVTLGDAGRGARLWLEKRCASCHEGPPVQGEPPLPVPELASLRGRLTGCMAPFPRPESPTFAWETGEREALAVFLRRPDTAEAPEAAIERHLEMLRCTACHERGRGGGMPPNVRAAYHLAVGEDSRELMDPPDLDGVHQKLRSPWIRSVLLDGHRARPYMTLPMPRFSPALVGPLVERLASAAAAREQAAAEKRRSLPTLDAVETGRRLVGNGGFMCITCHGFGRHRALGAPAPALDTAAERLQGDYLRRWVHSPSAVRPGTRMPEFFNGPRTAVAAVANGDPEVQLDAILAYLSQGSRARPPEGFAPPPDSMLIIGERPRVQRTILPGVSPRSLAIGFQNGLSLAVDLEKVRLAYLWQGGFLEMARKWQGRGNGPAELVGKKVWEAPAGSTFTGPALRYSGRKDDGQSVVLRFASADAGMDLRFSTVRASTGLGLVIEIRPRGTDTLRWRAGAVDRDWLKSSTNGSAPRGMSWVDGTYETPMLVPLFGNPGVPVILATEVCTIEKDAVWVPCARDRWTRSVLWSTTGNDWHAARGLLR